MKKTIITLAVGLLISVSSMAQSSIEVKAQNVLNKNLEKITAVVDLTEEEKKNYSAIKKQHIINHFMIAKEFKESNPAKFKEKVKENGKSLNTELFEAFGKKRAIELLKAARAK